MDVFHHTNKELADYLRSNEFDLIGLGFMAPRFKRTVEALCTLINKNKKEAWLVLGGTGPTPIPEYILKVTKADVVILGEAEETIVDLLYCKISNPEKISGIRR
jgi:anaerobic magnesium-protoporphyrin IX monomethyl ester cyclase